jgi:SAM-dependent methyltransferase
MSHKQQTPERSYDSLRTDRATRLLDEHYGAGIDLYSLWAEFPDAFKAWWRGIENVPSHPAQLHYAWLNGADGSPNGLGLNAGIRLATSSAIEQLGLNYSKPIALLDLGCGVGGTALQADLFLQQQKVRDFAVHGISIVGDQVRLATLRCRKMGARNSEFVIGNFLHLPYRSGQFDGLLAIESLCHVPPEEKLSLLKGCIRVLVPGGRLVILDGYLVGRRNTADEERLLSVFRNGWTLPELITPERMSKLAVASGFEIDNAFEASSRVRPSVGLIYRRGKYIAGPLLQTYKFLKKLGLDSRLLRRTGIHAPNVEASLQAGVAQKELVGRGVFTYHVHVLRRPIHAA